MDGLNLITPSSVSATGGTASISGTGRVDWGGSATQLFVNDVFSSTYDAYKIVMWNKGSANGNMRFRFHTGGSTYTSSTYTYLFLYISGASFSHTRSTSSDVAYLSDVHTSGGGTETTFFGPNNATPTLGHTLTSYSGTTVVHREWAIRDTSSTQHTGFTIYPGSGTFEGYLTVYGLTK